MSRHAVADFRKNQEQKELEERVALLPRLTSHAAQVKFVTAKKTFFTHGRFLLVRDYTIFRKLNLDGFATIQAIADSEHAYKVTCRKYFTSRSTSGGKST